MAQYSPESDEPLHIRNVMAANPFGLIDHSGLGSLAAELVFGRQSSGEVINISQAASGRACECVCPACGVDLIAKKGRKVVAHFAHAVKGSGCGHGAETNAHFWAKEILLRLKRIRLPDLEVEFEGEVEIAQKSQWLTFSDARSEVWMSGLVPDIILTYSDGNELHVEVHVTHRCGEEKIARLAERGIPSVEIDLSGWRTSTKPDEIQKALLDLASRKWLFHRKHSALAEAFRKRVIEKRLDAQTKRVADDKRRNERQRKIAVKTGRQIAENVRASRVERRAAAQIPDISGGARDLLLCDMECWGFAVEPKDWQASILVRCFDVDMITLAASNKYSPRDVLERIKDLICEGADGSYGTSVLQAMGDIVVGHAPQQAIQAFLQHLVDRGFLSNSGGCSFRHSREVSDDRSKRADLLQLRQQRQTQTIALLETLEKAVWSGIDPLVLEEWMLTRLPGGIRSPANMPFAEDGAWNQFKDQLQAIVAMVEGGTATEQLLGLPLEQELQDARTRQRVAEDLQAADRVNRLEQLASKLFGDRAELLLAGKPFDELNPRQSAFLGESELSQLMTELQKLHQTEQENVRRLAELQVRTYQLTQHAEKSLGAERASLFLRDYHPRLGRSPLANLDTPNGLRQALDVLKFVGGKSGRRG